MEKLPSQPIPENEILRRKILRAQDVAQYITTPGWIDKESIKSGQGLSLMNLSTEEYFTRLSKRITPMQVTLLGKAIPDFEAELKKLEHAQEIARIRSIRDRFNLEPLHPPQRNYTGILSQGEITDFLSRSNNATRRWLETLLQSRGATRIFNAIVRHNGTEDIESDRFDIYLAGAIFEEIGYLYSRSLNRNGNKTVLSPEETDILFKNIYPDRFINKDSYGLNFSVDGMSIPDGLVISNTDRSLDVVLVSEYKSIGQVNEGISRMKVQRQYFTPEQIEVNLRLRNHQPIDPSDLGRLIHAIKPTLPDKPVRVSPNLGLLYVIPKGTDIQMDGILIEEVPITTSAIHAFAQRLKTVKLLQRSN